MVDGRRRRRIEGGSIRSECGGVGRRTDGVGLCVLVGSGGIGEVRRSAARPWPWPRGGFERQMAESGEAGRQECFFRSGTIRDGSKNQWYEWRRAGRQAVCGMWCTARCAVLCGVRCGCGYRYVRVGKGQHQNSIAAAAQCVQYLPYFYCTQRGRHLQGPGS